MPDATISPRGIPPIRTDWIADIAWRLASIDPAVLRALPGGAVTKLVDEVDGERWTVALFRISEPTQSWVELEGDLYLPSDTQTATMRLGVALTAVWDAAAQTPAVDARIEVGPRGAVTFDPENWVVRVPLPAGDRPRIDGVRAGTWSDLPSPAPQPVAPAQLEGGIVGFEELGEIAEGAQTWTVWLTVREPAPRPRGLLKRWLSSESSSDPHAVLVLEADGPLTIDPLEQLAGEDFPDEAIVDRIEFDATTIRLAGDALSAAGGWVGISGPGLRVSAHQLAA